MTRPRLLVIEDNEQLLRALQCGLASDYIVDSVNTGSEAIVQAYGGDYDGIILDLGLPDISGLSVCKSIRDDGVTSPIMVITGEASITKKLLLYEAGVRDYVIKPFNLEEIKARLRVMLEPRDIAPKQTTLTIEDLVIDTTTHLVTRSGQPIILRQKEYAILECLATNAGTVVSRNALMNHAWSERAEAWNDTVNVHIKYLRDKVDKPFNSHMIQTVRGIGYKLAAPTKQVTSL